jgi:pyruvate, water dikinase
MVRATIATPLPNPPPQGGREPTELAARPHSTASAAPIHPDDFIIPLSAPAGSDPERVGPKAASLAALTRAGLPTPGGFSLTADAYRAQITALGLADLVHRYAQADLVAQRRLSVEIRLGLYEQPIAPMIVEPLLAAWHAQREQGPKKAPSAVRSSALIEDRKGANFAGQFESFLGIDDEAAFLTAVRACWAALWTTNARRYMENHGLSPADTAMAVLIQPLIDARASGGGLSETADGRMLISATWGLGSAIAQGEVVPDRIVLSRRGFLRTMEAGRKDRRETCGHGAGAVAQAVPSELVSAPCLDAGQAVTLGRMLRKAETVVGGPVEIEWALDETGFKLLQARPLTVEPITVPDAIWLQHPGLHGHPAGIGWGAGRAVVVSCECELSRVAPGDVLVTRVAGPALAHVLPRVAGVVAELGGSTSHLASLARERGIPMVLGVLDATSRIPDGAQVAVDGVAGVVRWIT